MAKKYIAVKTSSFMPFDKSANWVVIAPNGDIVTDYTNGHSMKQNDAIALAKKLNEKGE